MRELYIGKESENAFTILLANAFNFIDLTKYLVLVATIKTCLV